MIRLRDIVNEFWGVPVTIASALVGWFLIPDQWDNMARLMILLAVFAFYAVGFVNGWTHRRASDERELSRHISPDARRLLLNLEDHEALRVSTRHNAAIDGLLEVGLAAIVTNYTERDPFRYTNVRITSKGRAFVETNRTWLEVKG